MAKNARRIWYLSLALKGKKDLGLLDMMFVVSVFTVHCMIMTL